MSVEIVMPKLSDTMEEGIILKWLKNVGDEITSGEPIAEVETDKADMELEAAESGVLREIKIAAGESAAVGTVIALVDEDGKASGRRGSTTTADATSREPRAAAEDGEAEDGRREPQRRADRRPADGVAAEKDGDEDPNADARQAESVRGPETRSEPAEESTQRHASSAQPREGASRPEIKASPAARKIAAERGIDLRSVRGTGPDGRVVKEDVQGTPADTKGQASTERAGSDGGRGAEREPAAGGRAGGATDARATRSRADSTDGERHEETPARRGRDTGAPAVTERQELSRMRQSIARRMSEAFRDIPHFYVTAEIDMTEAVRLKHALEQAALTSTAITYTHMILKATALALRKHPRLNASYRDGAIEVKGEINLGLAVAVDDGLIVPVLRHVDELSLEEIARDARRLGEQAKLGRFASEDLSGGTFTISNMGMLDIEHFTAVINPPQAAILAVGAIKERAVVRAGTVVAARTMHVTLSCDHRIIDGVVGGRFLEELKRLLENPVILIVHERFAG